MYGISSSPFFVRAAFRLTAVGVYVEPWEIAAGNLKAQAVTALEQVAGCKRFDLHLETFPRYRRLRIVPAVPVQGAH